MPHPPLAARTVRRTLGLLASTAAVVALSTTAAQAGPASPSAPALPSVADPVPVTPTTQTVSLEGAGSPAVRTSAVATPSGNGARAGRGQLSAELTVDRFRLAAASWTADPAVGDVVVELRTRNAATWTAWTALPSIDGADPRATRGGTEPLWVSGGADGVQARVVSFTGAAPTDVRVDLVEPGTTRADARAGSTASTTATGSTSAATLVAATAAGPGPAGVITRAGWGADESIRTSCAPDGPDYTGTPKAAIVHHTAETNSYSAADSAAIVRGIYAYHGRTLGWCDVGYNFLVDKYGQVFEGRAGGMDKAVHGAHAGGFNQDTFGVAVLGDYTQTPATAAGIEAVARVIAFKFALHGTDPHGTATLTSDGGGTSRYARGTVVTKPAVMGHQDVGATACPGDFENRLGQIRDRVAQLVPLQPNALLWQVRGTATPGAPAATTVYGSSGSTPLSCDFDGDGRDDVAAFDHGHWLIRYQIAGGVSQLDFTYGWDTAIPVCGNWDGRGGDGIGVFENGQWYLRDTPGPGRADAIVSYGFDGAQPTVGDWNGDGTDTIGVFGPRDAIWMLRGSNTPGAPDAGSFTYGWSTTTPVVGDFDGDGRSDIGVFENGGWWLRMSASPGPVERFVAYGDRDYLPVTGDFSGVGTDGVGVVTKVRY